MAVVQSTVVACNTSTGTQDITISGLGTPKAALFFVTKGSSDATLADDAVVGWGVTDGTNQRAVTSHSDDAQSGGTRNQRGMTDECIAINAAGTVDGEANFDSWITDGVRINWGNAPAAAYLMTVVFFVGDISANVRDIASDNAALGNTSSDTTSGFEPDVIFFGGLAFNPIDDTNKGSFHPAYGFATNESGGIVQGSLSITEGSGSPTTALVGHSNQYCSAAYFVGGGYAGAAELTSFNSDGFTWTHREDTTVSVTSAFLAIKFNDNTSFATKFIDSPTSTGNADITSLSFKPQFVAQLVSIITTEESQDTAGAEAASFGISSFDLVTESCGMVSVEDNVSTTNTKSIHTAKAIKVIDNAGTTTHEATFVSFLSNGWRLNYTTADGTARKWIALAIEEPVFTPRMMTY